MDAPQQKVQLTLNLPKKTQQNDINYYKQQKKLKISYGQQIFQQMFIDKLCTQVRQNPELYYNFGFTHEDFKSFLMKLMYCRVVRNFIEKKRMQKIDEYNIHNKGFINSFQGGQQE